MKIYTKTGDNGTTSLYGGDRVKKHNIRVEAYGTIDELNSNIGMLRDLSENKKINFSLIEIQKVLFKIGAILATDCKDNVKSKVIILDSDIEFLENKIDVISSELKPMTHFIIPGGNKIVSYCHICRTTSRRAERRISQLNEYQKVNKNILSYINRLSDYFFIISRKITLDLNIEEIKWIP